MTPRTRLTCAVLGMFAVLAVIACAVFGAVSTMQPFTGDNIRILAWADAVSPTAVPRADAHVYPEWRPLAYLIIWLRYQWFGFDYLNVSFAANVFLWTVSAWLVGDIVRRLTHSYVAAVTAAVIVLIDARAVTPVIVIERANLLASVSGLLGVLIVVSADTRVLRTAQSIGASLLLLASGLGKEFGLAFAGGLLLFSVAQRRRDLAVTSSVALAAYVALRLAISGGAVADVCAEQGYFFGTRMMCTDWTQPQTWAQSSYNVAATGLNVVMPGFVTNFGAIGIDPYRVAIAAVMLTLIVAGTWSRPRTAWMMWSIAIIDIALNFPIYRSRNQLVAVCALGVPLGVGVASVREAVRLVRWPRVACFAVAAALATVIARQAIVTREVVIAEVADVADADPCDALADDRPLDPAFVRRIKLTFDMPNPDCLFTH